MPRWPSGAGAGREPDLVITIRNRGSAASRAGKHKVFVSCSPASSCQTLVKKRAIPHAIEPGASSVFSRGLLLLGRG